MCSPRDYHGLIKFDGMVYAFGGGSGSGALKSAECFQISTNEWTFVPDLP